MRRLEVLFLPHPVAAIATPWATDVIEAVSACHNLRTFDRTQPAAPQLADIEAIVDLGGNITPDLLAAAADAGVKFLQAQTTGLDHVDVEGILNAGCCSPIAPGSSAAWRWPQSAMMFILMHAHRYGEARRNFDAGRLYAPTGIELEGLTLGLIGFGASGQDLARRAKPFGLRILAIDIRPIEEEILVEIQPQFLGDPSDLDHVVAESDYLSLHLHLTPKTRHTIDARRIGLMKKSACLINLARGGLVDEDALYRALLDGHLGGAGLDVFAQEPPDATAPVFQLPNVFAMPHTAGSTDGTSRKRARLAADNLDRYARGEALEGQITSRLI